MKTILKLSLLSFLLFACTSKTMEEQKSKESVTSEESQNQELDKQTIQNCINKVVEEIEDCYALFSLSTLDDVIQNAINEFKGLNKKEFTKSLLKALTNENMLIKIRNIRLSKEPLLTQNLVRLLFDNNVLKFSTAITLKEESDEKINSNEDEENENAVLPQEIIAHIPILEINRIMNECPMNSLQYGIRKSFKFIKSLTDLCKNFYLLKSILLNELKKLVHQKISNDVLRIAALNNYNNIAQILVNSRKVNIDEMNEYQLNSLLQTFTFYNKKLAKFLIKSGANIEVKDKRGNTLLVLSILEGFENWVKMLLKFNANCLATNAQGYTALEIAEGKSHLSRGNIRQDILRLLQEKVLQIEENKNIKKESQN